jgi:outer membrane protein assembly factor BamE (lipoprotein component of BamABCDE complex)
MLKYNWLSLVIIISLLSCGKSLPELKGIDKESWVHDKGACKNIRSKMIDGVKSQKDQLLALSEMQLVELLGRPDENELYKRNQKFYTYYLEPGPTCDSLAGDEALKLVIRFNAMGLAKEVVVE